MNVTYSSVNVIQDWLDDTEDVVLDMSESDLLTAARAELERLTRGDDCQYVNLLNVRNNQGCTSG